MKNKFLKIALFLAGSYVFAGCEKDNYEPPESTLTGRVVYNGQPVGLRSNAVQLELWQPGYDNFTKIEVFVAQDGTFSSKLFDGDYKLVRRVGNGPWADNSDTINVKVQGSTTVDVPVDPYFIVTNETYKVTGTTVTATFNIQKINQSKNFDEVIMVVGKTSILDRNFFDFNGGLAWRTAANITDYSQPMTLSINLSPAIIAQGYFYVRLAAKAAGADERAYTAPFKITL